MAKVKVQVINTVWLFPVAKYVHTGDVSAVYLFGLIPIWQRLRGVGWCLFGCTHRHQNNVSRG